MGATTCLFSRARPGQPTSQKVHGFPALPGEIRNMIYAYYFQSNFRCEFAAAGCNFKQPERRTVKLWSGLVYSKNHVFKYDTKVEDNSLITARISRRLGKYNVIQGLQTNWLVSLYALNLVCKQVYTETVAFLYQRTVFFFDAPRRINDFLNVVSKSKLENITKLQLYYNTYGDPKVTENRIWQNKHNKSWLKACKAASKNLTGLRELEIWVQVHDSTPRFSLRERWVAPMLQFRRLTHVPTQIEGVLDAESSNQHRQKLQVVIIHIRTQWSKSPLTAFKGNQDLAKACTDLHLLFGQAIGSAILGDKEEKAMAGFNTAWEGEHSEWRFHLNFAKTGW